MEIKRYEISDRVNRAEARYWREREREIAGAKDVRFSLQGLNFPLYVIKRQTDRQTHTQNRSGLIVYPHPPISSPRTPKPSTWLISNFSVNHNQTRFLYTSS